MASKLVVLLLLPFMASANPGYVREQVNRIQNTNYNVNPASVLDITNDCLKAKFTAPNACAILYDDEGCEGWQEPITTGYRELGLRRRNDAESVVVKRGCTFTGYQHANKDASRRGRSITVDARGKPRDVYQDFNDEAQLESRISSVECRC